MKKAVIVGCEGQDGRLLKDLLLSKNYKVIGLDKSVVRNPKGSHFKNVDIGKVKDVFNLIKQFKPDEIYYLAAFHHSSEDKTIGNIGLFRKSYTVNTLSLINFLEAVRKFSPKSRLFYAASSHIFGSGKNLQDEKTPINPAGVYGITKASGLFACRFYRNTYSVFASTGILYNHESTLRSRKFVSKKIIRAAIDIRSNKQRTLTLGNLSAVVDFGYAPDYVDAMYRILNINKSDDFVIATGEGHSVLDFVKTAFGFLGLDWKPYVREDRKIIVRKNLCHIGNSKKLRQMTFWKPSVDFKGMVRALLREELALDE